MPQADRTRQAASLLEQGLRAHAGADYRGALDHLDAAIALLPLDDALAYELRDARTASLRALGEYDAELADLRAMRAMAESLQDSARYVAAGAREAALLTLLGDASAARRLAEALLGRAEAHGDSRMEAEAHAALAEASHALGDNALAEESCRRALERFQAVGDRRGEGHALRRLGLITLSGGGLVQAEEHFEQSLALCRASGDREGEARALNTLGIVASDYARSRAYYEQALAIAQTLGDPEFNATLANNLGLVYGTLGLYGQARAYAEQAVEHSRAISARPLLATALETLGRAYEGLGETARAHAAYAEGAALAAAIGSRFTAACCLLGQARVAFGAGQAAIALFEAAAAQFGALGALAEQGVALAWCGGARLAAGQHDDALRDTASASRLLEGGNMSSEYASQEVWWWRHQALRAQEPPHESHAPEAGECLLRAYGAMLSAVAGLSDAGLRRSYLCRVAVNRAIIEARLGAGARPDPARPLDASPDAQGSVRSQLTRMLRISARLNEQHHEDALRAMFLDEVVELTGAEHIVLQLNGDAGGLTLTRGPRDDTLLQVAAPLLAQAAQKRQPLLQVAAEEEASDAPQPLRGRSALCVPLVAGGRVVGALYADLLAAFGRFTADDSDLLSLLATQAATALENARLYSQVKLANIALEQRVAERTAALEAANAALEGRVAENARLFAEAQRAQAEAEAANAAKSVFLANMSHELRTPLNAILGFAQLATRDETLPERQRGNLDIIARSGEHLLTLIDAVLDMSKIEAGHTTLSDAPFSLPRLIAGVEELFTLRAAAKQIELRCEVDPGVPDDVVGDEAKLRQILLNLLGNAVKFTRAGGVSLRVGADALGDGLRLRVVVEDSGVGIAPDELAALFQPFVQTSSGRQSQEGTGLGLALSRQFARLMGGDITVSSAPGVGSRFTCEVLLRRGSPAAPPAPARRVIGFEQPDGLERRMLVVDDNWQNRRLLCELLGGAGFAVREARDGREALDLWRAWRPHIVWMDVRMPVMDGEQATRAIKATPQGQATVVVAVTASVLAHEQDALRAAGCDDVVTKPIRDHEIFAQVAAHLGLRPRYADAPAAEPLPPAAPANLPAAPRLQLAEAASLGDLALVEATLEQLRPSHPELAAWLAHLAADFRFEEIEAFVKAEG